MTPELLEKTEPVRLSDTAPSGCYTLLKPPAMEPFPKSTEVLRFGLFEFELRSGELRKQGRKIRLEGQPVQVLIKLLARPGELVTREELQKELWPSDTFVNFEQSLNAAVKRLRQALGDDPGNARFVETLARRGYRFIAPVGR